MDQRTGEAAGTGGRSYNTLRRRLPGNFNFLRRKIHIPGFRNQQRDTTSYSLAITATTPRRAGGETMTEHELKSRITPDLIRWLCELLDCMITIYEEVVK